MIKKILTMFNSQEPTPQPQEKRLERTVIVPKDAKHEALTGVTIKQVKEMLHSEDLTQVVKLYSLMTQRDLHLAGTLSSRRDQLQSLPYNIEGDKELVKFANEYLDSIKFNLLIQDLMSSLEYGFSVLDLVWDVSDFDSKNYFVPKELTLLSARNFSYDANKNTDKEALYFSVKDKKKYLNSYDSRKLLLHCHKTDTEHITKYSPLYRAAWFVALKHQVIASNMQWFDALGIPPIIINQDTADTKELDDVLYQALSLRSNSVGIFPKGVDAKLLSGGMSSKADFLSFIEYIDNQVSYFITGQTLAGASSKGGSYAQAKVHENRLTEKQTFDAKLLNETLTDFLNMVIEQNFADPKKVKFRFVIKEHRDLKEQSEIVKNLEGSGFQIPAKYIEEEFGIRGVQRKETTQNNAVFTQPHNIELNTQAKKLPLDKTTSEVLKLDLNSVEDALTKRLTEALKSAESYEEAFELLVADESVDVDELEKLLAKVMTNSTLMGVDDGKD